MNECGLCLCEPCRCNDPAPIDHEYTDDVVCPWCGHKHRDSWEIRADETNCHSCNGLMDVERNESVSYSTQRLVRCKCDRRNRLVERDECYLCRDDRYRAKREAEKAEAAALDAKDKEPKK